MAQKLLKIGSSLGLTIPKEIVRRRRLKAGDAVDVYDDAKGGGLKVIPAQKLTREDMRVLRHGLEFIERYRNDLEALARK